MFELMGTLSNVKLVQVVKIRKVKIDIISTDFI